MPVGALVAAASHHRLSSSSGDVDYVHSSHHDVAPVHGRVSGSGDLSSYTLSQMKVHLLVESGAMKLVMGVVISMNAIQVVFECDVASQCKWGGSQGACDMESGWLRWMNIFYLVLYTLELSLRIYVHRVSCFINAWDMFDGIIIFVGAMSEVLGGLLPSTGILRLFRLARLAKAIRFIPLPDELHVMIHGFMSALKAIGMGAGLMALMVLLWAVISIELFNDINHEPQMVARYEAIDCEGCIHAWESIPLAMFFLTRLVIMGEGWDEACLFVEEHPWAIIVFMAVYFTVMMGMGNLVLAVIVDKALQAHELDLRMEAAARELEQNDARQKFVRLCKNIDKDNSGHLTREELSMGYDSDPQFRDTLTVIDMGRDDMENIFNMLDKDQSGEISYAEFGDQLTLIKHQDIRTMMCFVKNWVSRIKKDVETVLAIQQSELRAIWHPDVTRSSPPEFLASVDSCGVSKVNDAPKGGVPSVPRRQSPSTVGCACAKAGQQDAEEARAATYSNSIDGFQAQFLIALAEVEERLQKQLVDMSAQIQYASQTPFSVTDSLPRIGLRCDASEWDESIRQVVDEEMMLSSSGK